MAPTRISAEWYRVAFHWFGDPSEPHAHVDLDDLLAPRACLTLGLMLLLSAPAVRAEALPRTRAGVSLMAQAGVGGPAPTVGPALAFDLGAMLTARWAIAGRLSAGGIGLFNMARLGVGVEYSLGERWTLGFGVAGAAFFSLSRDLPGAVSVLAPVRVDFALGDHVDGRGWTLSVEALPGLAVLQDCGFRPGGGQCTAPLTLVGLVGVGYTWK